jgi:hypothetical protein
MVFHTLAFCHNIIEQTPCFRIKIIGSDIFGAIKSITSKLFIRLGMIAHTGPPPDM